MAANFQESAEKTNQECHLNDLLQQGILSSSWDLPTSYFNPSALFLSSSHFTSTDDLSSYFRENKDQQGRIPLTLLPFLQTSLLLWLPNAPPFPEFPQLQGSGSTKHLPCLQFPRCLFIGPFLSACISTHVSST